jgi:glycerate kinase
MTMTRTLIAPGLPKGLSFTAVEVSQAMRRGWQTVYRCAQLSLAPKADGGKGTPSTRSALPRAGLMPVIVNGPDQP